MTDTIRAKQAREILDIWGDVSRQVTAITRKQVATFPQSLKPKTQRDLGVEINTEKSIEGLNKTLESKLAALEFLVQNLSDTPNVKGLSGLTASGPQLNQIQTAYAAAISTGDVIPLWNGIARLYQTPGLSRQSQEAVKTQLLELAPNLDALKYGYRSAISFAFQKPQLITGTRFAARPERVAPERVAPPGLEEKEDADVKEERPAPDVAVARVDPALFYGDAPRREPEDEDEPRRGEVPAALQITDAELDALAGEGRRRLRGGADEPAAAAAASPAKVPRKPRPSEISAREKTAQRKAVAAAAAAAARQGVDEQRAAEVAEAAAGVPAAPAADLSLRILELLRALSVYTLVRTQVDAEPRPISVADLDAAYKLIFQTLSQQEIEYLKEEAPRGAILPRTIRNIPDFDTTDTAQRLKAIQEELGIRFPPEYYSELRRMPRDKLDAALDAARSAGRPALSAAEQTLVAAAAQIQETYNADLGQLASARSYYENLAEFVERESLGAETQQFVTFTPRPLLEEPLEPEAFVYDPLRSLRENEEALAEYIVLYEGVQRVGLANDEIKQTNELYATFIAKKDAEAREEYLNSLEQQLIPQRQKIDQLQATAEATEREAAQARDALEESHASRSDRALAELTVRLDAIAARPVAATVERYLSGKPREGFGRGRPIDTRGLASLRLNYGAGCSSSDDESDSGSESSDGDALDFDDTRNEHYSTRPLRF